MPGSREGSVTAEGSVTRAGARERRWWRVALLGVAAMLLGVYADLGQYAAGFWGRLPELGAPWLLLAFAGGRVANRSTAAAALTGFLLVFGGLVSYGLFVHAAHGTQLHNVVFGGRAFYWAAVAAALGPAAGVAGAGSTSRRHETRRSVAWGFAVAVPLVECARVFASDYLDLRGVIVVLLALSAGAAVVALREVRLLPLLAASAAWTALGYVVYRLVW